MSRCGAYAIKCVARCGHSHGLWPHSAESLCLRYNQSDVWEPTGQHHHHQHIDSFTFWHVFCLSSPLTHTRCTNVLLWLTSSPPLPPQPQPSIVQITKHQILYICDESFWCVECVRCTLQSNATILYLTGMCDCDVRLKCHVVAAATATVKACAIPNSASPENDWTKNGKTGKIIYRTIWALAHTFPFVTVSAISEVWEKTTKKQNENNDMPKRIDVDNFIEIQISFH